jgi:hypothetical protein
MRGHVPFRAATLSCVFQLSYTASLSRKIAGLRHPAEAVQPTAQMASFENNRAWQRLRERVKSLPVRLLPALISGHCCPPGATRSANQAFRSFTRLHWWPVGPPRHRPAHAIPSLEKTRVCVTRLERLPHNPHPQMASFFHSCPSAAIGGFLSGSPLSKKSDVCVTPAGTPASNVISEKEVPHK